MSGMRLRTVLATLVATGALVAAPLASGAHNAAHQVNQGNLISALNNIAVQIQELNALNDLTVNDVRVVNVENVLNNNRVLNNALNRNNVEIITLRNVLNNCTVLSCITLTNVLNDNNVALNDVVAINVLSGGDVIIFTR